MFENFNWKKITSFMYQSCQTAGFHNEGAGCKSLGLELTELKCSSIASVNFERVEGHRRGWGVQDEGKYSDVMLEHSKYVDWPLLKLS